jgi:hypothetical protein
MQDESGLKRCLATAGTVSELIGFIQDKQGDLHETDILIEFDNSTDLQIQYFIVSNNRDDAFVLFENINNSRNPIDEDENIDALVHRHTEKNLIVQY